MILLSVRTELEDPEDVVREDSTVKVVHRQPERAARLVVGSVDHQKLGTIQWKLENIGFIVLYLLLFKAFLNTG